MDRFDDQAFDVVPPTSTSSAAPSGVPVPPANLLSADKVKAVRFHTAKPGYSYAQVEAFVDQVLETLTFLQQRMYLDDVALHEAREDIADLTDKVGTLQATIEVFRANGDPIARPDGSYVTEADLAAADSARAELDTVRAELGEARADAKAAWDAYNELRAYVDTELTPWIANAQQRLTHEQSGNSAHTPDTDPTADPAVDPVAESDPSSLPVDEHSVVDEETTERDDAPPAAAAQMTVTEVEESVEQMDTDLDLDDPHSEQPVDLQPEAEGPATYTVESREDNALVAETPEQDDSSAAPDDDEAPLAPEDTASSVTGEPFAWWPDLEHSEPNEEVDAAVSDAPASGTEPPPVTDEQVQTSLQADTEDSIAEPEPEAENSTNPASSSWSLSAMSDDNDWDAQSAGFSAPTDASAAPTLQSSDDVLEQQDETRLPARLASSPEVAALGDDVALIRPIDSTPRPAGAPLPGLLSSSPEAQALADQD